ncbi:hypothetical protein CROQUDRAFT_73826 [Cronartium quercuum f. sp. fusiforme G11]|uniref:Pre-mRNA-splicing factor SYF1 n=1 Tax=Cronartium quercuum f. sp. fusiforme G11 TaxID=708437 RepID=A0A9P6NSX4_9BASI|nr:hypothetical protein CROQUDRAFT_73826 [Cronartium quercuum f. sp. fusiforme G11]
MSTLDQPKISNSYSSISSIAARLPSSATSNGLHHQTALHDSFNHEPKTLDAYSNLFPITASLSTLFASSDCLSDDPEHLLAEQDLLLNPNNETQWITHLSNLTDSVHRDIQEQRAKANEIDIRLLGSKLASEVGRKGYRILVSAYERCLIYFPQSFKLWRDYLQMRQSFVLGKPKNKFNPNVNKKRRQDGSNGEGLNVLDYLLKNDNELEDNERDMDGGDWDGELDSTLGWSEWKALASAHERALIWLPKMPRLWLSYLTLLTHPACPAPLSHTHTRHTFDRALRTLPHTLHERIWKPYLRWSEQVVGGETCVRVWRRYLAVDPSLTAHYVQFLVKEAESAVEEEEDKDDDGDDDDEDGVEQDEETGKDKDNLNLHQKSPHKALIAAKLLLGLVRKARKGKYKSPDGKSPYQLLIDFMELCEKFPNQIGINLKTMNRLRRQADEAASLANGPTNATSTEVSALQPGTNDESLPFKGLVRFAGPPTDVRGKGWVPRSNPKLAANQTEAYDPDTDPANPCKLDFDKIVDSEGLSVYKDQLGLIYTNLATYWIKKTEFEKAREVFETGISKVLTIRDFTTIFDAYAEFSEQYISTLMDSIANEAEDGDGEDEAELDQKMKEFEELMDRRPFLVNDVLLRRNPNDVQEWEKRVVLYGSDQDEKIVETYIKAIETINPKKATSNFNQLFVNFAKWYEEAGLSAGVDEAVPDLVNARKVFERAVKVNFQRVDDLAEIWIEWAEMEVRNENYTEALKVIRKATMIPLDWKKKQISFHDESLPVQARLFKSLKLWSFRVDLEESIGTVESTQKAYDSIFELKIANAQIVINCANFLEENEYWEESFKVYERGIDLFSFPIVFEIWNTYLTKFIKRYKGSKIERARDLFEQALENCPEKFIKPIFLLYADLEENYGLAKRAMSVLERATTKVALEERFDMFAYYIAKATENFGLPATRPIYQRAIECLPNAQTAEMCLRFASLEQKLGEIDRARAIYAHASQFCDPRTSPQFWETYHNFEIQHGSEDTFREMLRIKRAVQASFNTETSYLAAKAAAARAGTAAKQQQEDAMSQLANGNEKSTTMSFVPSTKNLVVLPPTVENEKANNVDEIAIDDDDDE